VRAKAEWLSYSTTAFPGILVYVVLWAVMPKAPE